MPIRSPAPPESAKPIQTKISQCIAGVQTSSQGRVRLPDEGPVSFGSILLGNEEKFYRVVHEHFADYFVFTNVEKDYDALCTGRQNVEHE